jgi:hypothetical protein
LRPNVSKDETKAEILQRFSGLRWTSDASPPCNASAVRVG